MSVNNNYHHLTIEKRDYSSIYERSNQMQFEQKRKTKVEISKNSETFVKQKKDENRTHRTSIHVEMSSNTYTKSDTPREREKGLEGKK